MTDPMNVDQVLNQIRAIRQQAGALPEAPSPAGNGTEKVDFGALLKQSVDAVNTTQSTAGGLAKAFEQGDQNVSLTEVMVALQKANVSFQAMVETRNKLVEAYQEVMRMSM